MLNSPRSIATAFCSNHERTIVSGRSFTVQPNASASAMAIFVAEIELLHCPRSMYLGISVPGTVP
jgi:hypothetical protein